MHVQYVALCDQVVIGADGRPTLVGVLSDLQAPQLPVTLPRLGLAARVHFTSDETGRQVRVEVLMTDPNGVEIGRPGGEVTLPSAPPGLDSVAVDIPLHFDMFEIGMPGRYTFLLHVDGKPQSAAQLNVRIAPNAQPA